MTTKHTPGPWRVEPRPMLGQIAIYSDDPHGMDPKTETNLICAMHNGPVNAANAALIASAPDLLAERDRLRAVNAELVAALRAISCIAGNLPDDRLESRTGANDAVARGMLVTRARMIARAAIAKATGDAP